MSALGRRLRGGPKTTRKFGLATRSCRGLRSHGSGTDLCGGEIHSGCDIGNLLVFRLLCRGGRGKVEGARILELSNCRRLPLGTSQNSLPKNGLDAVGSSCGSWYGAEIPPAIRSPTRPIRSRKASSCSSESFVSSDIRACSDFLPVSSFSQQQQQLQAWWARYTVSCTTAKPRIRPRARDVEITIRFENTSVTCCVYSYLRRWCDGGGGGGLTGARTGGLGVTATMIAMAGSQPL